MDATTFFLTYPQSNFSHENLFEQLQRIKPILWARVGIELHEDGNPHAHVLVRFGARVKTRSNMSIFDIMGRHPNIQVPRRLNDVLEYVAKDGNFRDFGPVPIKIDKTVLYDKLREAAEAGDRSAFDRTALANRVPFNWAKHIWEMAQAVDQTTVLEPSAGTECLQLQALRLPDKPTAIIGPSGCGKTSWALRVAPKPSLLVSHLDDLKKLRSTHKSIIFDDMDFKHLPRATQIYVTDSTLPRSIHVRYGTATIPANMPKIFTGNSKMFLDDPAINRRIQYINIVSFTF